MNSRPCRDLFGLARPECKEEEEDDDDAAASQLQMNCANDESKRKK